MTSYHCQNFVYKELKIVLRGEKIWSKIHAKTQQLPSPEHLPTAKQVVCNPSAGKSDENSLQ